MPRVKAAKEHRTQNTRKSTFIRLGNKQSSHDHNRQSLVPTFLAFAPTLPCKIPKNVFVENHDTHTLCPPPPISMIQSSIIQSHGSYMGNVITPQLSVSCHNYQPMSTQYSSLAATTAAPSPTTGGVVARVWAGDSRWG